MSGSFRMARIVTLLNAHQLYKLEPGKNFNKYNVKEIFPIM